MTLAFQQLQREHGKLKEEETEKSKKLQVGWDLQDQKSFSFRGKSNVSDTLKSLEPMEAFGG